MKLVIDIDEEMYKQVIASDIIYDDLVDLSLRLVQNFLADFNQL